jgi:hypothetical protein
MVFLLSPGVLVQEIDLTTIVPAVGTTEGAYVGNFAWGPIDQIVTITDEIDLVRRFFEPTANTYEHFYTCANFLSYARNLKVVRVANTNTFKNSTADGTGLFIKNEDDYEANYFIGEGNAGIWAARYPGSMGNSLLVSICPTTNAYSATMTATVNVTNGSANVVFSANVKTDTKRILSVGDLLTIGTLGEAVVTAIDSSGLNVTVNSATMMNANLVANSAIAKWAYYAQFDSAPGTSDYVRNLMGLDDEMHIMVIDEDGKFTERANTPLERFGFVSKAIDAINSDGSAAYYRDVIRGNSKYIWWLDHLATGTNWGTRAAGTTYTYVSKCEYSSLSGGVDTTPDIGAYLLGLDLFRNKEEIDISLIMTGNSNATIVTYAIQQIAEPRQDCIVFCSPRKSDVIDNRDDEMDDIISYRNTLPSSSYGVMDSNWKYQFDKYNNVYRWIPLNGDIAGLCVRTDFERDPWFSPAGFNRGQIKNSIKLAWKPNNTHRDELYKKGINPALTFPGEGTILFGDKTLLSKPSAFDRINVRRLFIVLEKAIARAAKYSLFEFNDAFTRAQFVALVEPFLRDVKGRRGIFDFRVVCDETNNTGEVIDRNEFIGDIYIKPARSINFITLRFIAVRTSVSFEEVVGRF